MRALILGIYLGGVVVTFGHEATRSERERPVSPYPPLVREAEFVALTWFVASAAWPIYWPLRLSYLAFAG